MMRFTDSFFPQRVVFGRGEAYRLAAHLSGLRSERILICSSGTYSRNGVVNRVRAGLEDRHVALFDGVRPHVPEEVVAEVVRLAADEGVQCLIALGGGSAIGTAKATTAALGDRGVDVPIVAIPTTYAGSEMTAVYGTTRGGRKVTFLDRRVLPALVVYDADPTLDLPPDLTAGTGANALAHCVEGAYSLKRAPLASATALAAIRAIDRALPCLLAGGDDIAAREEMLAGAHLGGVTIAHAGMALHHAVCHALGGAGLPHGVANAIMLPHVMRFNLSFCVEELAAVGDALGLSAASDRDLAGAAIDRIAGLFTRFPLPNRLRDTDLPLERLPAVAAAAMCSSSLPANPRPVEGASQIEEILHAAW